MTLLYHCPNEGITSALHGVKKGFVKCYVLFRVQVVFIIHVLVYQTYSCHHFSLVTILYAAAKQ